MLGLPDIAISRPDSSRVNFYVGNSKGRQASVADFFDSGRMKQPGQENMPMALGQAADILGHTKPGDLGEQADLLVGAAEELAGI